MKTDIFTLVKSKPSFKAISVTLLGLSLLSACQKTPESETAEEIAADTTTQTTPISSNINAPKVAETKPSATDSAATLDSNESENELSAADTSTNSAAIMPNPEQAIKGAQITDVNYRSASGETLFVIFETSEKGVLNAIVTLPNKPKMTLSAPEGQGNNPTYRSNDGSIQLVSHGGGSSIDLIQNNKTTSFEAISVEAEVITE